MTKGYLFHRFYEFILHVAELKLVQRTNEVNTRMGGYQPPACFEFVQTLREDDILPYKF